MDGLDPGGRHPEGWSGMRTTDGVPDGASFSSASFSSAAGLLRAGAALADYLDSPAGTDLEPAAPGAALASAGEIRSRLAARAAPAGGRASPPGSPGSGRSGRPGRRSGSPPGQSAARHGTRSCPGSGG